MELKKDEKDIETEKIERKIIEIRKKSDLKENNLKILLEEIKKKSEELESIQKLIESSEINYKTLLRENKEILEKIKIDLNKYDFKYKEMQLKVENIQNEFAKTFKQNEFFQEQNEDLANTAKTYEEECHRLKENMDLLTEKNESLVYLFFCSYNFIVFLRILKLKMQKQKKNKFWNELQKWRVI